MTATATTGQVPVFDQTGRHVANVGASSQRWLGTLLAQCDVGHVYILTEMAGWDDGEPCPRCRVLAAGEMGEAA